MVGAVRASPLPARADTEGGGGGASSGGGGSRLLTGPSAAFPRSCAVRAARSPRGGRPRPAFPGAAAAGGPRSALRSRHRAGGLGQSRERKRKMGKVPPRLLKAVTGWARTGCGTGRRQCGVQAAPHPETRWSVGKTPDVFLFPQYQKGKHFSSARCERPGRVAAVPGALNMERARGENPSGFPGWIRRRGEIVC